jgi:hypothetical protein
VRVFDASHADGSLLPAGELMEMVGSWPLWEAGVFPIARLRLNRAPLVALRRARRDQAQLRQDLATAQDEWRCLRQNIINLERELNEILTLLSRLLAEEN